MAEKPILFSGPMVRAILAGNKTQTRRAVKPQPDPAHWQRISCGWYEPIVIRRGMQEPGKPVFGFASEDEGWVCPYGKPGGRLWVRENGWERPERTRRMMREGADTWEPYYYDTDLTDVDHEQLKQWGFRRRPSIHMPRWASRITLRIEDVKVERVQEISEADAMAEGFKDSMMPAGYAVMFAGGSTVEIGENYVHGIPKVGDVFMEREVVHVERRPETVISTARDLFRCTWDALNAKRGYSWEANPWVWAITFSVEPRE